MEYKFPNFKTSQFLLGIIIFIKFILINSIQKKTTYSNVSKIFPLNEQINLTNFNVSSLLNLDENYLHNLTDKIKDMVSSIKKDFLINNNYIKNNHKISNKSFFSTDTEIKRYSLLVEKLEINYLSFMNKIQEFYDFKKNKSSSLALKNLNEDLKNNIFKNEKFSELKIFIYNFEKITNKYENNSLNSKNSFEFLIFLENFEINKINDNLKFKQNILRNLEITKKNETSFTNKIDKEVEKINFKNIKDYNVKSIIEDFQKVKLSDMFTEIIKLSEDAYNIPLNNYYNFSVSKHKTLSKEDNRYNFFEEENELEEKEIYESFDYKFKIIIFIIIVILFLLLIFFILKLKKKAKPNDVKSLVKTKNYELRMSGYFN